MNAVSIRPPVLRGKVPSVKTLLDLLGLQLGPRKEMNDFVNATHSFMSNKPLAPDFLFWNSPSVQKSLRLVAEEFLEDNDNGYRFWSPTRTWGSSSNLNYPNDREKIIDLLVQLFWRQNLKFCYQPPCEFKATECHTTSIQWKDAPSKGARRRKHRRFLQAMTYDDIEVNGIVVLRRRKDNWLNANQILKVAGLGKKTRESILQRERVVGEHEMVLRGATKYRGTWINFERGRELCKRYGVEELLYPLLTHHMSI